MPFEACAVCRVLIVDDNATNRQLLVKVLRKWSIEAVAARAARRPWTSCAKGLGTWRNPFDPAGLPDAGMDGFETARRIREDLGLTVPDDPAAQRGQSRGCRPPP